MRNCCYVELHCVIVQESDRQIQINVVIFTENARKIKSIAQLIGVVS